MGVRGIAAAAAVGAAALLAAGCGGSGAGAALHARLLTAADLPAGWSSAPIDAANGRLEGSSCLSGVQTVRFTHTEAAFLQGTSIPNMGEVLATGTAADRTWTRFDRALAGCRSATLSFGKAKATAAVRPLSLPRLGGSASAYAWSFVLAGIRIGFDLVLFHAGTTDGYLTYADLGSPATATVTAFARAAIAKARSGSTSPVPGTLSVTSTPVRTVPTTLGKVAYRSLGHGTPLLLITGYGGTMTSWDRRFVDALALRHRVVLLDNAGVGRTSPLPAPLTIDTMADQTSALATALRLGRADVLGWSMGSMVAQALAVRHPAQVRRLVLCATYPGDGTTVRPSRHELDAFESGRPAAVLAALFPPGRTAAQNAYLTAVSSYPAASPAPPAVVAAQGKAVDAWWSGADPAGRRTSRITAPTLVADGTADRLDPVANSRAVATLIRGALLRLYPDAGHAFLFQEPGFLGAVESFLR